MDEEAGGEEEGVEEGGAENASCDADRGAVTDGDGVERGRQEEVVQRAEVWRHSREVVVGGDDSSQGAVQLNFRRPRLFTSSAWLDGTSFSRTEPPRGAINSLQHFAEHSYRTKSPSQ